MTALLDALHAVAQRKLLWLIHLGGNAAAAVAVWWWLGLPESTAAQIALSLVSAAAIIFGVLWMHTAALAAYRGASGVPWRHSLRRAGLLLPWLAAIVAGAWAASKYIGPVSRPQGYLAFAALFLALTPLASWLASGGAAPWRAYSDWRYYAGFAAVLGIGCLPIVLLRWVPTVQGLSSEIASFAIRLGLAYAIAVSDWLLLAALAGRTTLPRSQPEAERE
ncbi:MAG: hypothetical protein ACM3ZB_14485 [bacterium]|jgi:hypothetical protein